MEGPDQDKVLFPSDDEVKSYFPLDVWNTMSEYERKTYKNLLHNYNVMRFLDLKPKKPSFMTLYQKKGNKKKAPANICPVPVKKCRPSSENKPKKKGEQPKQLQKTEQKKTNMKNAGKQKNEQKKTQIFTSSHKWKSITLHCIFTAVFKVYKRYHGTIKGHYPRKRKTLKISKKYMKEKLIEKSEINEKINTDQRRHKEGHTVIEKANNEIKEEIAKSDTTKESKILSEPEPKEKGCAKPSKTAAVPPSKPVCRSVQTMTVAVGGSPSDSALVFVNAASCKKSPVAFPDPKPLTPQEQKLAKKINKQKMKNRRNVQTQTAPENSSIEDTNLVFFPKPKPKKPKKPSSCTQPDASKVELANKGIQPDNTSASDCGTNVAGGASPHEQSDNGTNITTAAKECNDTDPEDEFGFYALFNKKTEGNVTEGPLSKPEPKPQPDEDMAVPGCSFWPSRDSRTTLKSATTELELPELSDEDEFGFARIAREKRYPKRAVPVVNYTEPELLKDDEYLFCDLCDREYEGDCPEHGPHKFFPDRSVTISGDDKRAIQTTPAMLKVDKSKIPGAGSGVWTMMGLPPYVRFGPYEGDEASEPDPLGYSWAIVKDKQVDHYIAAQSTATSNWMRFVNCARHVTEQNLMAFQYKGRMYYRTVKLIPPKAELFVWYGKEYAELLGISMESFRSKDTSHLRDLVFPCHKCNVTYTSPLYLEAHEKRCRGERVVVKVEPSRVPTDVETLAVVVDGRKTFCCNLCTYKTTHSGNIKYHMVVHSGERPHKCDVCGKGFTQAGNLDKHKRIHTGDKPYKCTECSYTSSNNSDLRRHMTRHTGEKTFACPECDYKTTQSGHMERHCRTHTGLKPYICTVCDYRAAHSHHLTVHMRTHTGEKPYSCTVCDYRAAHSGDLTRHMRTHTGEKPFPCPHCQYRTAQKGHLNSHITRHHPGLQ